MGGGGDTTQNTQAIPWQGVQPFLLDAFNDLSQQNAPSFFPGSTIAPQSSNTQAGIQATADAAGGQQAVANQTGQQFQFFTQDALSPDTNPFLKETAQNAIKPIFEQLTNTILPGIDRGAVQAGGFGGTAQANLQKDVIDKATGRAFDVTNDIYSGAFERGSDRAAGLVKAAPFLQSVFSAPGASLASAGGAEDAFAQANINEDINRFNFGENAEFQFLQQYLNTLQGVPFGQTTMTSGGGPSNFNQALAGGALGVGAQSVLGLTNPWLLPLIGLGSGALL